MKKSIIIITVLLLTVISLFTGYFFIYGGKAQFDKFEKTSEDYEAVAQLCLEYYREPPSEDGRKTLGIRDGYLTDYTDGSELKLNDEQNKFLETVKEDFDFLWVTEDNVIFWRDETKYYGLIYSDNPLSDILEMKSDWYKTLDYHRINSHWYEIGFFGI